MCGAMDADFWNAPYRWPRDPFGYIFLARAFNEVGKVIFQDDWTGNEAREFQSNLQQIQIHVAMSNGCFRR
jgi:hypothetical protein